MEIFKQGLKSPSLIRVLRNVLQQNPDNGQVLKELLQNAEDAGATEVTFLLDWTTHPADPKKLIHPDLVQFQGPALYVHNDKEFTDDDWAGICMVNHSLKESDPTKIGRFGVGFKSVFHMTDLPGLLTGRGIGFMDPLEKYFKVEGGKHTSCQAWDLVIDRECIASHIDQFNTLLQCELFETSSQTLQEGNYRGMTLFRFPLRSKATDLSDTIYTPEKVKHLFQDLVNDADIMLIFTKNLKQIEVHERTLDKSVRRILEVKKRYTETSEDRESFTIEIEVYKYDHEGVVSSAITRRWKVSLLHGQEIMQHAQNMSNISSKLSVLPLVGAAIDVTSVGVYYRENIARDQQESRNDGRIFSFLPVPLEEEFPTGLPCHVNGTFALDQTRQHVKFPSADQDRAEITDHWLLWNLFLLNQLIPAVVAKLALQLTTEDPSNPRDVYSLMPDLAKVRPNWKSVAESFYQEIYRKKYHLFYAENATRYLPVADNSVIDSDTTPSHVRRFLELVAIYPIILPPHVLHGLENCCGGRKSFERVTPQFVAQQYHKIQNQLALDDAVKMGLLGYLMENNVEAKFIIGLHLVPLEDGSWTYFRNFAIPQDIKIYELPADEGLRQICRLPGPSKHFLRFELSPTIKESLEKQTRDGALLVEKFDPQSLLLLLSEVEGVVGSAKLFEKNTSLTESHLFSIWQYLRTYCPTSLQRVEELQLRLVPFGNFQYLSALTKSVSLIHMSSSTENELVELFQHANIIALIDIPEFVTKHPAIYTYYIFPLSVMGVTKALRRVEHITTTETLVQTILKAPDRCKEALRQFFARQYAHLSGLSSDDKRLIKRLPIFLTQANSAFRGCYYVHCSNSEGVQLFPKEISVPKALLDLDEPNTKRFAEWLDVRLLSNTEVIRKYVFPGINAGYYKLPKTLEDTMKGVLSNCSKLIENRIQPFLSELQKVKFIPKNASEFSTVGELYDSDDIAAVELFEGKNKFPVGEFALPQYRKSLRTIGLKGMENILVADLVELANEIHENRDGDKAKRLMEVIERMPRPFNLPVNRSYKTALNNLNWIVPMSCARQRYPDSLRFSAELVSPCEVLSDESINLVGSVIATITIDDKWKNLAELFGWNARPNPEDVIEHFSKVIDWFQSHFDQMPGDNRLYKLAQEIFGDIYAYLEVSVQDNGNVKELLTTMLSGRPCVLVEAHLMIPSRCTLDNYFINYTCLPFVCSIPNMAKNHYGNLLRALNVRQTFQLADYIDVLNDLYRFTEGKPLDQDHLRLVLFIINDCLADGSKQVDFSKYPLENKTLYVPDERKVLRPSSDMWYGPLPDGNIGRREVFIVHPDIKETVIVRLGVGTMTRFMLDPHVESFGQKDRLEGHLRGFLDKNPFDAGTLKELVLNADNSGATRIHFIIDPRHLPDENVFDDNWKSLQGPALTIFSDCHFTERYLQGIQDPGNGDGPAAISTDDHNEVGFNCMYHLTDAPEILTKVRSERRLYILDPTHQYITFASPNHPNAAGFMIRNIGEVKDQFPDVFAGFLEEYLEIGDTTTILRLCLRKQSSDLSELIFDIKDLEKDLLDSFRENIRDCFLFLNNIKEIAVKRICRDSDQLEDVFVTTKEMNAGATRHVQKFQNAVIEFSKRFQKEEINKLPASTQVDYDLRIRDSNGNDETWAIAQRLGFQQTTQMPDIIRGAYDSCSLNQLPLVGVAYQLKPEREVSSFKGRIFCFLPLSGFSNLPVHINGHFALEPDNRRTLINEDGGRENLDWNKYLVKHLIAPLYCDFILTVKEKVKSSTGNVTLEQYQRLFPSVKSLDLRTDSISNHERALSVAVYKRIASRNFDVLPVILPKTANTAESSILWFKLEDQPGRTGWFDLFSEDDILYVDERKKQDFRNVLIKCGVNLFAMPIEVYECFIAAKVKVKNINPETVLTFFQGKTAETFSSIEKSDQLNCICSILEYCSQWSEFKENLSGTPLQVTQENCVTNFRNDNLKFVSTYADIVPQESRQFIHSEIVDAAKLSPSVDEESKKADVKLCKHFGIDDFANLLPFLLPSKQFRGPKKKVDIHILDRLLESRKATPSWIQRVWNFLGGEVKSNISRRKSEMSEEEFAKGCLRSLNQWCLLPVESTAESGFLVPISSLHLHSIMTSRTRQQLEKDEAVLAVLEKLGYSIVKLDHRFDHCEADAIWLLELLLERASPNASMFVVTVLHNLLNSPLPKIDSPDQQVLIYFLAKNIKEFESDADAISTLKKLPFLADAYCSYIFKQFAKFTTYHRIIYLRFLKNVEVMSELSSEESAKLVSALKALKFISRSGSEIGKLLPASEFFDPRVELFRAMEQPLSFPPKPFTQDDYQDRKGWLDFLVQYCGLVGQISETIVWRSRHKANRIEA